MSLARIVADNFPISPTKTVLTGNGTTTAFTIAGSTGLVNPNELIVTLDGAVQEPTVDYTINSNTITFTTAPDNGAKVVVVYRNSPYIINSVVPSDGSVTNVKLAADSVTPDKLSPRGPTWNSTTGVLTLNEGTGTSIGPGVARGLFDDGVNLALRPPPNGDIYIQNNGGTSTGLVLDTSTNSIGIKNLSPKTEFDVDGTISFGRRLNNGGAYPAAGYLSNIWTATHGYRFFTLGSTYFDGTNWITNDNATYGSNYVCNIIGDISGVAFSTSPNTGNTERSDSNATFNSYERLRINTNGVIDFKNNPVINCTTMAKAWINFNGDITAQPTTIAPAAQSISTTAGQNTGIWTVGGGGFTNDIHLGITYFINVANAYNSLGGIPAVAGKGVQIKIIEIISTTQARVQYTQNATSSTTLVGTGTVAGWQFDSDGIRSSYNISAITNLATGRQRIFFSTPFSDRNSIILTGATKYASDNGSTAVVVGFDRTTNTPQTTYCDIQTNASNIGYNNQIVSLAFFGN